MTKINKNQLFSLVLMGQIGSTNLWALGIEAKQDAWIVILLSTVAGLGLIFIFTQLNKMYPDDNITGITISILGKGFGYPLAFIYFLLYTFNTTRNVSEFADLVNMSFLHRTPRVVIMAIFFAAIIYILFLGIETLARITEIIMPITILLIISLFTLIIASGKVDMKELTPVLENGFKPVAKAFYPVGVNFPFGLSFVFFQFWPYVDSKSSIRKFTLWGVGISGILLTITIIIMITTIGTDLAASSTIPFLEVIKLINIADFITNLDAIGVILVFIGGFYLAIFHFFSATIILSTLFKIKDYRWVLIPLSIFITWYTFVYEPNYPFHVKFLLTQFWQQFVPLYNIIPMLLLIISWLKKSNNKDKSHNKAQMSNGGK